MKYLYLETLKEYVQNLYNIALSLKFFKIAFFSIFLFCPLWCPIIILNLVSRLSYVTLGIGYNSHSLLFWESERVLITNLEISTNKVDIYT